MHGRRTCFLEQSAGLYEGDSVDASAEVAVSSESVLGAHCAVGKVSVFSSFTVSPKQVYKNLSPYVSSENSLDEAKAPQVDAWGLHSLPRSYLFSSLSRPPSLPLGLFPLTSTLLPSTARPLPASPQDLSPPPLLGPSPHLASTRPLCQGSKSCLSPLPLNPASSCILIRGFVSTGAHSDLEVLTSPSQNFCSNYCPHHKFCV